MYEFYHISEHRHSFYQTQQKPSRIKNVGQYFYTSTLLALQEILEKVRGILYSDLSTDVQRYRETSHSEKAAIAPRGFVHLASLNR